MGFGVEGRATYDFLKSRLPEAEIHIFDDNSNVEVPRGAVFHNGHGIPPDFDVVYKTPGIPTHKMIVENPNTKISSLTNLFLENIKGKVIGVTGTKGKSTTASLVHHILSRNGKKSVLVGNIGTVALMGLKEDSVDTLYVYEMSSFQCEFLDRSPHISVISNLFSEHLDHHGNQEAYKKAKLNITKFQTEEDYLVIPEGFEVETKAQKIFVKNRDEKFETQLRGDHNQQNIALAIEVAKILGISETDARLAVVSFVPLQYRIEKLGEYRGIEFYDDSLATIPEATLATIKSLGNVTTLILGGFDRGVSYEAFANEILKTDIKNFIVFPDTGAKMVAKVLDRNIKHVTTMEEAVREAYNFGAGVCLLSNASSSFNLFKDYKDKSAQYRKYIEQFSQN